MAKIRFSNSVIPSGTKTSVILSWSKDQFSLGRNKGAKTDPSTQVILCVTEKLWFMSLFRMRSAAGG
jgi:hypothetical protein